MITAAFVILVWGGYHVGCENWVTGSSWGLWSKCCFTSLSLDHGFLSGEVPLSKETTRNCIPSCSADG